jgi:(2Fe-2S) ferredoxin
VHLAVRDPESCLITVCRDCCCGTVREHPDVDHAGQLVAFQGARGGSVRVSQCLGACEISNVVIVNPSRTGRSAGGRLTWLGRVLLDDEVAAVVAWVEAGGPGLAPMPAALEPRRDDVARALSNV